jgi:hypothetical protein
MCLWKIGERTLGDKQGLEPREYLASRSWHKSVPDSGHVKQILSPVISNYDGVHAVCEDDYNSRDCLDGVWVQLGRNQRLSTIALEF